MSDDTAIIEIIARSIARTHFSRKLWHGVGTKEASAQYLVNQYWRNNIEDAQGVLNAIRNYVAGEMFDTPPGFVKSFKAEK